ncbi:PH domain-like protein, partial [Martensiomyces pterosporus]
MAPSKLSSDARKKLAANLQVLRRYDSEIQAIIDTTSHVVLYQFQHDTSSWAKKDVEGALFIFQRASAPCYGFMVMNRLSLDNYTELLNPEMNFQPSDQFLIYRSDGGDVIGIWIYEESDRIRISSQLEK